MEITEWLATVIAFSTGSLIGGLMSWIKHRKARVINIMIEIPADKYHDEMIDLSPQIAKIIEAIEEQNNVS